MEFVTIHDLSRELNAPERVIRYRLLNLIAEGKMKEHEDFRRDDFKDDQHFVWKIHPLRFMHESAMKRVESPLTTGNNIGSEPPPPVNQPVNTPPPRVNEPAPLVTKSDDKVDTKPEQPSLAREMIDILKEQIGVKDRQLSDVGEQLKVANELNEKLIGVTLKQADEIKNLIQLPAAKTEKAEVVIKEAHVANSPVNEEQPLANNVDNNSGGDGYQSGNESEIRRAA